MTIRFLPLLAILLFSTKKLQAGTDHISRDSVIHPSAIAAEVIGGIHGGTSYISGFVKGGLRYEFRRKSAFGFATGLNLINDGDQTGFMLPLLLTASHDGKIVALQLGAGVTAQTGAGQPFFFPTIDSRIRIHFRKTGLFLDFIANGHFNYGYACTNGSYSCNGSIKRTNFNMSPGIGTALGYSKRKK